MYPDIAIQQRQVIGKIKYLPAVSIILPFHPVITKKDELKYSLMLIMHKIEQDLLTRYAAEKAVPVLIKLKNVIRNLNYRTHKRSIAIFVSPVVDKVYYLDMELQQQIVFDDSFEMRNILLSKKQTPKYVVMFLGNESCKMYRGNCSGFTLIKSNISDEISSNEFSRKMDQGLSIILKAYPLPLMLIGPRTVLERFKKITANKSNIIQHVEVCREITGSAQLRNILMPYEANWKELKQVYLLKQIEKARAEDKLAVGMDEVWDTAMQNKGKLLIIEKKYLTQKIRVKTHSFNNKYYLIGNPFYIKDEVDEIIEKVFENDGDVEFIDEGVLKDYKQIVLIEN